MSSIVARDSTSNIPESKNKCVNTNVCENQDEAEICSCDREMRFRCVQDSTELLIANWIDDTSTARSRVRTHDLYSQLPPQSRSPLNLHRYDRVYPHPALL